MISKVKINQIDLLWSDGFKTVYYSLLHIFRSGDYRFFDTGKFNSIGLKNLLFILFILAVNIDAPAIGKNSLFIKSNEINYENTFVVNDIIPISDTIVFFDTVYTYQTIYDTVYFYDTVYVENMEEMSSRYIDSLSGIFVFEPSLDHLDFNETGGLIDSYENFWSIEGYVSVFNSNYQYSSSGLNNTLYDIRKASLTPKLGYNYGVNINYHFSNSLYLQSGLALNQYNESLIFKFEKEVIDTFLIPELQWTEYPEIDTIMFLNVDSLVLGDSVWAEFYDTVMVERLDTIYSEDYQVDTVSNEHNRTQKWSYIEIPLIVGFKHNWGGFSLGAKTGLLTGFLYKTDRYEIYSDKDMFKSSIQENKELELISLAMYLSADIEYQFTEHWLFLVEPWLKLPMTQFSNSEDISLKIQSQGLRVGIRYYL